MKLSNSELQILKLIDIGDGISRKALSERSNISQAGITTITKNLINCRYIVEGEHVSQGLGRKEVLLYSNPQKFRYLGIDIGGHKIRIALSDNHLNITHEAEYLISDGESNGNRLVILIRRIKQFLSDSKFPTESLDAIGIGITGIVDSEQLYILNIPNSKHWDGIAIVSELQKHFRCFVFLDEGGRTMALAEKNVGKAKTVNDFIVIQVGFGLVSGIMIDNHLLRGANNVAGLLGHTTVDERAGKCLCGNYGCLELIVTFPMIEEEYRRISGNNVSIIEGYKKNDKVALNLCITIGNAIGIALSNVVNLFNPQMIYLGGPVFDRLPIIFDETKRTVILRANRFATLSLIIEKNSFGDREGVMGALSLAKSMLISQLEFTKSKAIK